MNPSSFTEGDMLIRLVLSFVAGTIIGLERASRRQIAGLRTHILICMGACLLMVLSIWLPGNFSSMKNGDPGRIAAQVVSGIGFLGAGAIIRLGNNVRGLTTAASLWFIAAVGMAIGAGMFATAALAEAVGLFTLFALGKLEKKIFPSQRVKLLEINYKNSDTDTKEVMDIITAANIKIQSMDVNQSAKDKETKLRLLVSIPSTANIASIAKRIRTSGNISRVEIKEKY
jgi:putative Mg2+ transporter-C (MgtC) family protein